MEIDLPRDDLTKLVAVLELLPNGKYQQRWLACDASGAVLVHNASTDIQPPEDTRFDWAYTTAGSAAQDSPDLSAYQYGVINISGLTGETVAVVALIDGTVVTLPVLVRKTDGTFVAATALGNGLYYVPLGFKSLRFTKSAAVETVVVTCSFKQTGSAL